jgi:hypothetical protein
MDKKFFLAKHDFTIRHQTLIAQRLPDAFQEELVSFKKFVLKLRKQHKYWLGQVWNTGYTPVFLYVLQWAVRKFPEFPCSQRMRDKIVYSL